MDEAFTVTLPSNSNMREYPKNTPSEYTVKLATPLNFMSDTLNVGNAWQVALVGLQYTNQFYEVPKPIEVSWKVRVRQPGETRRPQSSSTSPDGQERRTLQTGRGDRPLLGEDIKAPPEHYIIEEEDGQIKALPVAGTFTVNAGHYKDIQAVAREFLMDWNQQDKTKTRETKLSLEIDGQRGTLSFKVSPPNHIVHMYVKTPELPDILGLPYVRTDDSSTWRMLLDGDRPPRFKCPQSLYVYTDIIKEQFVGDVLAPLLEVVPVQQTPGSRVNYRANPAMYLPLKMSYIDTISVKICDETGEPIQFPPSAESVVLRLRFRHLENKMLF